MRYKVPKTVRAKILCKGLENINILIFIISILIAVVILASGITMFKMLSCVMGLLTEYIILVTVVQKSDIWDRVTFRTRSLPNKLNNQ